MLEGKGAKYTGKSVEVDGNIITGNGPDAAREFGRAIAKALG
jgi:protease I